MQAVKCKREMIVQFSSRRVQELNQQVQSIVQYFYTDRRDIPPTKEASERSQSLLLFLPSPLLSPLASLHSSGQQNSGRPFGLSEDSLLSFPVVKSSDDLFNHMEQPYEHSCGQLTLLPVRTGRQAWISLIPITLRCLIRLCCLTYSLSSLSTHQLERFLNRKMYKNE